MVQWFTLSRCGFNSRPGTSLSGVCMFIFLIGCIFIFKLCQKRAMPGSCSTERRRKFVTAPSSCLPAASACARWPPGAAASSASPPPPRPAGAAAALGASAWTRGGATEDPASAAGCTSGRLRGATKAGESGVVTGGWVGSWVKS